MSTPTVAIDFDHTLHDPSTRNPGYKMGTPYPGAREALERLRNLGVRIVIHTCRARSELAVPDPDPELAEYLGSAQHVMDWLDYFAIPYDEVTAQKPMAFAYVDDKAVPFLGDWASVEKELIGMFYLGVR